jgi:hypothetical protein
MEAARSTRRNEEQTKATQSRHGVIPVRRGMMSRWWIPGNESSRTTTPWWTLALFSPRIPEMGAFLFVLEGQRIPHKSLPTPMSRIRTRRYSPDIPRVRRAR